MNTCKRIFVNSLDAERKAQEAKGWVARKISKIGTISRELNCARYCKHRLAASKQIAAADRELQKALKSSIGSIAWLRAHEAADADVIPEGVRLTATGGGLDSPATVSVLCY